MRRLLSRRRHLPGGDDRERGDGTDERESLVVRSERRAGVRAQPPFADVADQADADRAAQLAQELIVLEPCAISTWAIPSIEPRLSEGMIMPRPIRPITAHSVMSASEVAVSTPSIRKNDAASRTRPAVTMRLTAMRSASLPAIGIVAARTSPAGSSTAPACDGGRCSASCMKTGTR